MVRVGCGGGGFGDCGVPLEITTKGVGVTPTRRRGLTIVELITAAAITALLAAILLPAIQATREASRRNSCRHALTQIGLAAHQFVGTHQSLPSNGGPAADSGFRVAGGLVQPSTMDLEAGRLYTWGLAEPKRRVDDQTGPWPYMLLPFLEQYPAFERPNYQAGGAPWRCPSRNRDPQPPPRGDVHGYYVTGDLVMPQTDFAGNDALFTPRPKCRSFRDINDGLSNTVLAGEKSFDHLVHGSGSWYWDEPIYIGGSKGTVRGRPVVVQDGHGIDYKDSRGSAHPSTAHFLYSDGHVETISLAVDREVLAAKLTP